MKILKYSVIVFLTITMMVGLSVAWFEPKITVRASESDECLSVIKNMVEAVNNRDIPSYINCFVESERKDMEDFTSRYPSEFFREKEYKLVNIKELPKEIIPAIGASISRNANLDGERFFYCGIDMRLDREEKWLYNGINYRVIVMDKEDNNWKIGGIIVPSYKVLVDSGYGFGTSEEVASVKIEEEMERTGLVKNYRGDIIKDLRSTDADLKAEKGLITANDTKITTDNEQIRPSSITVYFTHSSNINYWGNVRAAVPLYDYVQDVLPNEWEGLWPSESLKAGALACKMYGWYHVYHPKWNYSPYYADVKDNTADQQYFVNSRYYLATQAINNVGGIGICRNDGNIFETHHFDGSYNEDGYHSGWMSQHGTKYWADSPRNRDYDYMVHYYYDYSPSSGNQLVKYFYY
ncbi:MAG: hypothetical protein COZ65_01445 [Caldiserica bacterium CG_4_8_14_3_um_filter_35_18]|nr:MAG: hypothetical protein COZ65_01445 [Caldiserica bacterium CG_4_8_14_3_um_filter_35_18]